MTILTRESLERVLGPLDEAAAAEIAELGASEEELLEARSWLANEEAMRAAGKPLPTGRVAQFLEWLERSEDDLSGYFSRRPARLFSRPQPTLFHLGVSRSGRGSVRSLLPCQARRRAGSRPRQALSLDA